MKKTTAQKSQIADLLYPVNGYRGQLAKKGIVPKDHQKDNLKIIKEKQTAFIEKKSAVEEGKKESMA